MNDQDLLRYSRQILLPEIDVTGQQQLQAATVLIMGLGGLGSPAALYLAAAGIGKLILADPDIVEISNLQRQIIHGTGDIGQPKVQSAEQSLTHINPDCQISTLHSELSEQELDTIVSQCDLVLDCTDNFDTRFLINRVCKQNQVALVSGAAIRWEGQISLFTGQPGDACYQCLYDDTGNMDENCTSNGVIAPLVGIIGSLQALEAIKWLTQQGSRLENTLLIFDALNMQWRNLKIPQDRNCPVCQSAQNPANK